MPWACYVKRVSLSMRLTAGTCSSIRISFLYHVHIFHIAPQLDLCIDGAVFARGLHAHDAVDTYVKATMLLTYINVRLCVCVALVFAATTSHASAFENALAS